MKLLGLTILGASAVLALSVSGVAAQGTPPVTLSYAAVGDSITYEGVVATGGWVDEYRAALERASGTQVSVANLGQSGARSDQILASVMHDGATRAAIAGASIVTYQAGINDFFSARTQYIDGTCGGADNQNCLRAMVAGFDANWDQLVTEIHALAPRALLRTMNIYYSTAGYDEAHGIFGVLNLYLTQMNAHIAENAGAPEAHVHAVYNGTSGREDPASKNYLLSDGVHPGWLGQVVILARLQALGYAGLEGSGGVGAPSAARQQQAHARAASETHGWLTYRIGVVALAALIAASAAAWYARRRWRERWSARRS